MDMFTLYRYTAFTITIDLRPVVLNLFWASAPYPISRSLTATHPIPTNATLRVSQVNES